MIELIEGKTPTFTSRRLLDDDLVQTGLAQAQALWASSRAFLPTVAEECAFAQQTDGEPSGELRAQLRLAATNAIRRSGDVVRKAYDLAGSDAIFDDHPLQRCFQDIHAAFRTSMQ